eukprot:TRINITY_DN14610_c0_g1_i1.p1 TRINITY_DN14610_c0_g1~~TRINITY_DN14610_c0_g1_i1.p1  ORF type:complete len:550 (+),score=113.11 TRINITY_DN14610_c0_g1_i1:146-1795(+)
MDSDNAEDDLLGSSPRPAFLPLPQAVCNLREAKNDTVHLPTDTVVKIYNTETRPSYLNPWQVLSQRKCTGTGFVIEGRRIVTNAHIVDNATVLQVQKQEEPKKYRARVSCIAHDLDLAIVTVEDKSFWADQGHSVFAEGLPDLYSEVKCVGFPSGGATVCVTKGVLSRIDAHLYVHPRMCGVEPGTLNSPGNILILQIDAAINPGNSGGPTFDKEGKVVGIASSSAPHMQNLGYIVPSPIVLMFLDEFDRTGRWSGLSELGLLVKSLEHDTMREFLKMGDDTGVLVSRIAPLGALHEKMNPGDVITHIDGHAVSNEGKVPITVGEQKVFVVMDALITRKPKGDATKFRILRDGNALDVEATLGPIPPLAPRFHNYDSTPEYILCGGLIFTRVTVPLKQEYLQATKTKSYTGPSLTSGAIWEKAFEAYKERRENHDAVILLRVLQHDINIGCSGRARVLKAVNEQEISCLPSLAKILAGALNGEERFVRFQLLTEPGEETGLPDLVLPRAKIADANRDICMTHRIPEMASDSLRHHFGDFMSSEKGKNHS